MSRKDLTGWTLGEYIDYVQLEPSLRTQGRLYGKDIAAPDEWQTYATERLLPCVTWKANGQLPEGGRDVLCDVPEGLQAESVQIYVGYETTLYHHCTIYVFMTVPSQYHH